MGDFIRNTVLGFCIVASFATYAKENTVIQGIVKNPEHRFVVLLLQNHIPGRKEIKDTIPLSGGNSFKIEIFLHEPVYGQVYFNNNKKLNVYLLPQEDLVIDTDVNELARSTRFSGAGAVENTYLLESHAYFNISEKDFKEKAKKLKPEVFIEWANRRKEDKLAFLEKSRKQFYPVFYNEQKDDILYSWANDLFTYARLKNKKQLKEDYFKFVDEVKLHHYNVITLKSYRDFLDNYLQYSYKLHNPSSSPEAKDYYKNMFHVAQENLRSLPKFHMQAHYLHKAIVQHGVDYVKDEYIIFLNESPDQEYKNALYSLVNNGEEFVVKPEVVFIGKKGEHIPLLELAGKVVLVRFQNQPVATVNENHIGGERFYHDKINYYIENYPVIFLDLDMKENRFAYNQLIYEDAQEYLRSIINRPKPGQAYELPLFSYVILNSQGRVVSNSLDDPENKLAFEKLNALLHLSDNTGQQVGYKEEK